MSKGERGAAEKTDLDLHRWVSTPRRAKTNKQLDVQILQLFSTLDKRVQLLTMIRLILTFN